MGYLTLVVAVGLVWWSGQTKIKEAYRMGYEDGKNGVQPDIPIP